jgi:hypothetical protein
MKQPIQSIFFIGQREPKTHIDKDWGINLQKLRMMSPKNSHEDDLQESSLV